jgi:glutathione S-transferase
VSLVPPDPDDRLLLFGLSHEILGEGGILWCARLLVIHAGLTTEGREGFPPRLAGYLGTKYGYAPERIGPAKERVLSGLRLLSQRLDASRRRGFAYFAGPALSALDIYVAAAFGLLAPLPDELCPMLPMIRHALETIDPAVRGAITPALIEHRDFMYQRHLTLPIQL